MGETKKEIIARLKAIEVKLDHLVLKLESVSSRDDSPVGGINLAMDVTCLSRSTIYNLVSARKIPHLKKGKRLYFKRKELEAWMEGGRRKTVQELNDRTI